MLATGPIPNAHFAILRLMWWLSFKTKKTNQALPKVTVVIPVYNVEHYLTDCLRSVRAQRYGNVHIIAVNDGATDSSPAILNYYEALTPNLSLVNQANQGLGAARNAGLDAIQDTDYVMFLDSDDLLPRGAIERFVRQAEQTGSPLVVGKTVCFYGSRFFDRTSTAALYKKNLSQISVDDLPEILGDATSWNKLYNWQFWKNHDLRFPVGVNYEDMTLVVTAFIAAGSFDLLAAPAYFWRVRAEGESLSKRTAELKSLQDRLLSIEQINKILLRAIQKGLVGERVHQVWLTRIISLDLQLFVSAIAEADQVFFDTFKARAGAVLSAADESIWAASTGKNRAAVWAAVNGTRDQSIKTLAGK
jgi:glycosyltransferase involved in cell wall biosynthesis